MNDNGLNEYPTQELKKKLLKKLTQNKQNVKFCVWEN